MADAEEQLKRMVMTFRVSELQMLLGYAGKNKTGRKNELQSRALEVVRMRNATVQQKIRELYKSIQLEMMSFGDRAQAAAAAAGGAGGTPLILPTQRVPSGMGVPTSGYGQQSSSVGANLSNSHQSGYNSRSSSQQVAQGGSLTGGYSMQSSLNTSYPISPDVRLRTLPFYDILGELLKPSTLAPQGSGRYQEGTFTFSLTPQQANKIAHSRDMRPGKQDYTVQVQMRFCLLETTCEQEDNFPPNITVKINDKMCPLPSPIPTNKAGVEPKRPPRPVNVTALCRISPTVTNRILVSWASEYGRCYVISVYLVQKLTSDDLLTRLKNKGPRLADFTRSLIKQKLKEDIECEIATTSLRCSLLCPLGKMRMALPCRSETCNHLQCFDASLFLQMNERKPTWTCPVCDKSAMYENLVIDGYFQEILEEENTCTEVTLMKDGSWTPLIAKKEKEPKVERKSEVAVETLSDDSDSDDTSSNNTASKENDDSVIEEARPKRKAENIEIVTLTDSEDDQPPAKKQAYSSNSASDAASVTKAENSSNSSSTKECPKSNNDAWCVGEVDPGKKLIFRKSASCSSNGSQVVSNNGHSVPSPASSGGGSPPIICLDSPVASPSPPIRRSGNDVSSSTSTGENGAASGATVTSSGYSMEGPSPGTSSSSPAPITYSSPSPSLSMSSPANVAASLAPLGSELRPVSNELPAPAHSPHMQSTGPLTITPVPPNHSPSSGLPPYGNLLQDPTYSSIAAQQYGLQNIFGGPLQMMPPTNPAPPSSSPQMSQYNLQQDRYM